MTKLGQKLTTLILSVLLVVTAVVGITWGYKPTANATESIINPIAKYEFKDANDLGKDSMGNYNMSTLETSNDIVVDSVNGGVTYSKNLWLSQDATTNMFKDLHAFTLCFELIPGYGSQWQHFLGVGTASDEFSIIGCDGSETKKYTVLFRSKSAHGSSVWNSESLFGDATAPTEYQKVVISVQPGKDLGVYVNGVQQALKTSTKTLPEDFTTATQGHYFTVGGRDKTAGGNTVERKSEGSLRNLQIYDFAMDSTCVTAYNANGQLTTADIQNFTNVNPIAKYEFKDASNLGKDTMGNYDMVELSVDANGKELQGATLLDGGGVSYKDNFCIAQTAKSNMFKDVTAFTLCFEIMTDVESTVDTEYWEQHIGIGRKHNKSNHLSFIGRGMSDYKGQLRIFERSMLKNEDNSNASAEASAPKVNIIDENTQPTEFYRYVVTVQPGGKIVVYVNGNIIYTGEIPEGFSYDDNNKSFFSIGGRYSVDTNATSKGLQVDKTASGSIRNVQFYDFAMDATCVKSYDRTGVVNTAHLSNLNTITSVGEVEFDGEISSEQLNDGMTADEMLSKVNDASAVVTLSNGSTTSATITWTEVITDGEKYFVKGSANTSKLGYANLCGYEVSYELPVIELPKVVGAIKGASVSAMGDFGLNFYVTMAQDTQNVTATMVMDGNETTVNGVYVEKEGAWLFAYPVAAKDFDKNVTLTITEVNGVAVDNGVTTTYSVKAYADNVANMELGGVVTQELKDLANALNNYCQQTKIYFANEGEVVKETNGVVSSSDLEKYASVKGGSDDNATIVGASLILESKTRIHVYFKSTGQIQCFVNGNEVTAQAVEGQDGLYVIAIEVLAQNLDDMFEIQIGGLTLNYGAFTYIRNCIDVVDAPLYNALQALYDYGMAANNYFN